MKKMTGLIILAFWLFVWQTTAAAANWMFVQRLEGTRMGACNEYIDEESVARTGDRMICWTLWLYDKPFGKQAAERILSKKEVVLNEPGQVRTLEYYHYNQAGDEVFQYLKPMMYSPLAESYSAQRALQYVRDKGGLLAEKPTDIDVSPPRWFTSGLSFNDFELLFDIRSIKALPKLSGTILPAQFEITVKRAWREQAVAVRQAELMKQKPTQHAYAGLAYSVTTYRFRTDVDKMMVLLTVDQDRNGVPMTFTTENTWRELRPGSVEMQVRQIGLNWFRGDMEGI